MPQGEYAKERWFLRYLTLSSVNYAFWVWLVYLMASSDFFVGHPWRTGLAWAGITFLSPVALGALVARVSQKGTFRSVLERLGFRTIHPIPTAWDYVFMAGAHPWALVHLKSGGVFGGRMGQDSVASSDARERDLYMERVYRVQGDDEWEPIARNRGMLISADQIAFIQFFADEEEHHV